ncbi:hypothetical protein NMY22_g19651 [Coprinellus aureogranulatus]|nr:hypothetical protein NMY22_g19651 [Coprinellus aureogranulatus]
MPHHQISDANNNHQQTVLRPEHFAKLAAASMTKIAAITLLRNPLADHIRQQGTHKAEVLKGLAKLEKNRPKQLANGLPDWSEEDGLAVLKQCHNNPTAGHPGKQGTSLCQEPLPVPDGPWESIGVDLVIQLPKSNGFDAIAVFTDKMIYALPYTSDINSEGIADLFYRKIFCLHGLPLGANGQTERANQEVEKYLCLYASRQQDDWDQHLPMAKFVVNSRVHSAHSRSPFEVIYGHLPHFNIPLQDVRKEVEAALQVNKACQKQDYETGKRMAHSFQINDYVWLCAKNIAIKVPTRKLSDLYLGPFKIIEKVSNLNYRLQLPDSLSHLHPVFHIDKLYPWKGSNVNGILPPPPDPIELDGEEEWEVQEVLDSRWTEHCTRKRGHKKAIL